MIVSGAKHTMKMAVHLQSLQSESRGKVRHNHFKNGDESYIAANSDQSLKLFFVSVIAASERYMTALH